jgi:predicted helicase
LKNIFHTNSHLGDETKQQIVSLREQGLSYKQVESLMSEKKTSKIFQEIDYRIEWEYEGDTWNEGVKFKYWNGNDADYKTIQCAFREAVRKGAAPKYSTGRYRIIRIIEDTVITTEVL